MQDLVAFGLRCPQNGEISFIFSNIIAREKHDIASFLNKCHLEDSLRRQ